MEKKKDYNYLIELFNEWNNRQEVKREHGEKVLLINGWIHDIRSLNDKLFERFDSLEKAIQWLEEQLTPTYEDALQFISDNEDKEEIYYVYYDEINSEWKKDYYYKNLTPFIKYMTEEKCKEFIEKFKNVKPKV